MHFYETFSRERELIGGIHEQDKHVKPVVLSASSFFIFANRGISIEEKADTCWQAIEEKVS